MGKDRQSPTQTADAGDIQLEAIPLHSTNLLTLLDEEGVIQYESPSIERIYGFSQEELVGEQVADYFHPEDRERVLGAFQSVVTSDEYTVEAVEYRHRQADGTYLWVESVASADPTPEGHYVVNTRDVSERKERERRLERTNDRLEAFASVVSHDLRNPLNVAQGRLELAIEECDSDHLAPVADAHDRMETLIDELLTVARVGNDVDRTTSVELATVAETCWGNVATEGATLAVRTDRVLQADRSRLKQLLENCIRNAVEHGGETVTIGPLERGFYVEDDGPGIPPEERDDVFDAGYSSTEDGTGFGLSIVKQVTQAHDWTVEVTDGSDGGARFEFTGIERE